MNITEHNKSQWQVLYKAAEDYRDFEPWNHFDDSYIFGVQDPESGEIGWCVIMGEEDNLYGLIVYVGEEGFESYDEMVGNFGMGDEISYVLNQKCLKVEFVNRDELEDFDTEAYKELGLKYQGENQYPLVRRNDPGLFPWPMEETQAAVLTHCLEQSVHVVQQAIDGNIQISDLDDDELLVMVPETRKGKDLEWKPVYVDNPGLEVPVKSIPDAFLVNRVKRELKKKGDSVLFLSFQYLMSPVQEKEEDRPFFPRLALWVNGDSGLILDNHIYPPGDIWKQFQHDFIDILNEAGHIPESIGVNSSMGMDLLDKYGEDLDIDLVYAPDHPVFEQLNETMDDFF